MLVTKDHVKPTSSDWAVRRTCQPVCCKETNEQAALLQRVSLFLIIQAASLPTACLRICLATQPALCPACTRLCNLLCLLAQGDNAALMSEIDNTSEAYEAMQSSNTGLVRQLAERDARISQMAGEQLRHEQAIARCKAEKGLSETALKAAQQQQQALEHCMQELHASLQVTVASSMCDTFCWAVHHPWHAGMGQPYATCWSDQ